MSEEKTHSVANPCSRQRFSIAWRKPPIPQKRSINLRACAPKRSEPFCIACCFANRGGEFKIIRAGLRNFVVIRDILHRLVLICSIYLPAMMQEGVGHPRSYPSKRTKNFFEVARPRV